MTDINSNITHTHIRRAKLDSGVPLKDNWRVYRSSPSGSTLQIRGPEKLANYSDSKVYGIIASASLSFAELTKLRDAINEVIDDFPEYAKK